MSEIQWNFSLATSPSRSPSRSVWHEQLHDSRDALLAGDCLDSVLCQFRDELSEAERLDDFDFDVAIDNFYDNRAQTPVQGTAVVDDAPPTHVQPLKPISPLKTPEDVSAAILSDNDICKASQASFQNIFDRAKHSVNQHPKKLQRALIADLERARLEFLQ